ncbi:aldo/keto reductase [Paenibacillus mendelii]|uniref:Aldo/keto reductase n=1 Tax=Paenibacillus mendelii TaxID=206163 RepID=A0ABV6JG05_9BACL|nr:aldo/keto reductase [Paenibacillus mendelii]
MKKRDLGNTGVSVGEIGMGCMPISVTGRPSESEGIRTIHAALEAGVTLLDTADSYCLETSEMGHNERVIAKALRGHPNIVVATKGGMIRPEGRWECDGRPERLREACEASLRALERDAITLYQYHRHDPKVPFAESIGLLAELRKEGKIVHVGLSNITVEQLEEANAIVPIASVQNRMNVFDRSSMKVLKRCEELGIAFLPYSPLNGMGKAGQIGENDLLSRVAAEHGISPQQAALAWLLQLSPVMIPIPGASRGVSIASSAGASSVTLSHENMDLLNAAG